MLRLYELSTLFALKADFMLLVTVSDAVTEGAAQHTSQRMAVFFGGLSIAVIIVIATGFADVIYLVGGADALDATGARSFGHALVRGNCHAPTCHSTAPNHGRFHLSSLGLARCGK